jgi:predicted heme/steroid binding protein
MSVFAKEKWRKYDNKGGIIYIACNGNVYDISHIFHWKKGIHQVPHHTELELANTINKPCTGLICIKILRGW